MNKRWCALALLLAVLLGGCSRASMSPSQATRVAEGAFESAGLDAKRGEVTEAVTVDRAIDGKFVQVHQVEMRVEGRSYLAGVSRTLGAVVRLVEPADTELSDAEVTAIAEYRDNPAEDDARRQREAAVPIAILLGFAGLVVFFRRERHKAERLAAHAADEIIPLT